MKTLRRLAALALLAAATAAQAQAPAPADAAAIDRTLTAFGSTLAAMDFDAFANLFTDDADFVNIVGMHWHGRAQIVNAHRVVFTTRYHGQAQRFTDKTEALLAPGTALVVGTIKMDDYVARDGKQMTNNFFRMTLVLKKRGDQWLIRSAENTVIDPDAAKHDPGLQPTPQATPQPAPQ